MTFNWIPVAQQEPPRYENILVYYRPTKSDNYAPGVTIAKAYNLPKGRGIDWVLPRQVDGSRVTHWAPLPPPPEEES